MNAVFVAVTALGLFAFVSRDAAFGCLLGGAVVMVNLYLLAILGRVLMAAAGEGGAGAVTWLGALVLPLKLLLFVGLLYLVFTRVRIDALGFALGVLTQLAAVIIETGRVSTRTAS
jgi:hypothetical protein